MQFCCFPFSVFSPSRRLRRLRPVRYARETLTEFLSVQAGTHYVPVSQEVRGGRG